MQMPPFQAISRPCRDLKIDMRDMVQVAGDKLVHLGSAAGKITHSGKFRLTIGCLGLLAAHAKYKVCKRAHEACPKSLRRLEAAPCQE